MKKKPSVLIITAQCGEPQFAEQKEQIKEQKGVRCIHEVISNLTTIEAEKQIFEKARSAEGVDWILRLDGDMTFKTQNSLRWLVEEAERAGSPERYSVPVDDYYTGKPLMGVHLMRVDAIPRDADIREYRPEQWIQELKGVTVRRPGVLHVNHGFNPGRDQLIRFALHRVLKAAEGHPLSRHWITLNRARLRYKSEMKNVSLKLLYTTILTVLDQCRSDSSIPVWKVVDQNSEENRTIKEKIYATMKEAGYSPDTRFSTLAKIYTEIMIYKIIKVGNKR